jgi:hypothetical protein
VQACFNVDLDQDKSIGILKRKLERTNIDEFNEDDKPCIQFFIIWKVDKF